MHCSAGVGRSGTFIAVDTMLQAIEAKQKIDVLNFVYRMRIQRMFMIQTEEQYVFVHIALVDSLTSTNVSKADFASFFRSASKPDKQGNTTLGRQFEHIQQLSQSSDQKTTQLAMEPENQAKNRYANILPYDSDRVRLRNSHDNDSYINASYIPGYRAIDRLVYFLKALSVCDGGCI